MPKHHDYDALPTDAHAPSFRKELRVVGAVIVFVIILEIIARVIAPDLDYDRKNIHAFPETISNLEQRAKKSNNPRIVFFGNSLMMHGLKQDIFQEEMKKNDGPEFETTMITPVGTAMLDWVYLYRRYFESEHSHPDILVVGFVRHHIHDQEPIKLRRLSRHFVAKQDLPTLWQTDLGDFHSITQSTLCNISALEGDQPEHQLGILYTMVPEYQAGVKANNRLVAAAKERKTKELGLFTGEEPEETYGRMTRFIEKCKKHDVKIIFVPMPQPHVWDFNPKAEKLAETHGMTTVDARQIEGMTEADFSDGYHLGETGADKFSRWLAREIQAAMDRSQL
jgi:hypothetical protein